MSQPSLTAGRRLLSSPFLLALAVVGGMLALIFFKSFQPGQVLFSNDAPLGLIATEASQQASTVRGLFSGFWQDLNWLGIEQPAVQPGLSLALYLLYRDPVINAKVYGPASLLILGLSAWFFFRRLGFRNSVCVLGGLAAALNMNTFSHVCWGLPSRAMTQAAIFLALAAIQSAAGGNFWIKGILAGMAVGLAVMEGFDVGALYSLYVAAFALFAVLIRQRTDPIRHLPRAGAFLLVIALCAGWFSAHTLKVLVGTQIVGVAGTGQDEKTREQKWDGATYWSLPKVETLRVLIPGLFGYRMDTENGGNYWGRVGEQPGLPRHSGAGEYAGILVVLVAAWGVANSFRKQGGPYSVPERPFLWFWAVAAVVSILLAWGRHAPFYQAVYSLPYLSTIRNPIKFMHFFHLALLTLFAFGLEGLARKYLAGVTHPKTGWLASVQAWWKSAAVFDRQWVMGAGGLGLAGLIGLLIYISSSRELASHLTSGGFPPEYASAIARFSYREAGVSLLIYALCLGVLVLVMSGYFSGPRARAAWLVLGVILAADLARANAPWIHYYDYRARYASGPLFELLKQNAHEHRVTAKLGPFGGQYLVDTQNSQVAWFASLCNNWLQNQFQFYNIASLEVIQMPRIPALDERFLRNFQPANNNELHLIARMWQLTGTRLLLGQRDYTDVLNQNILPGQNAFRLQTPLAVVPRASRNEQERLGEDDITTELSSGGVFGVIEFTRALPRAKLFTQWTANSDDAATLGQLRDPAFDPFERVLVADSLPAAPPGNASNNTNATAAYVRYSPKEFSLKTESTTAGVLLVNDKYTPNWKVFVDGREEKLLRCNFIMRGVAVPPGTHTVEFKHRPPVGSLYITLSALAAGLALCGFIAVSKGRSWSPG